MGREHPTPVGSGTLDHSKFSSGNDLFIFHVLWIVWGYKMVAVCLRELNLRVLPLSVPCFTFLDTSQFLIASAGDSAHVSAILG